MSRLIVHELKLRLNIDDDDADDEIHAEQEYSATVALRDDDLNVIADATHIVQYSTGGASAQTYSKLEVSGSSQVDLESIVEESANELNQDSSTSAEPKNNAKKLEEDLFWSHDTYDPGKPVCAG